MRTVPFIAALVAALAVSVTGQTNTATTGSKAVSSELANVKFIAGLFWASANGLHRRCAATVITNNTLVTSAACAMSDYPTTAYGAGEWRIVAGNTDDRYLETVGSNVTGYSVANVDIDKCANFAVIQLKDPMVIGSEIQTIFLSSHSIDQSAQLYTYNTSDPTGNSFLSLAQGSSDACEMLRPGYVDDYFICTQPVQNQHVTGDYLGGDPIIGFSSQPQAGSIVALVGITGMYYSTIANAQHGEMNDPTAYRFNPMVAPQVNTVAAYAGVNPTSIITTGNLT
ncbi:hypothetical protein IW140_004814 [Coemansia sp. RSA 1813]|nr:hypothetical protein EV178_004856 [Coemansia sp. RSA 1646]KAJ1766976.1 hypothetical protein LPJ74_005603 [Coemansia sp. RSA 1843]KAJ2088826.1 hypothetical protein IW138_003898 [Coemansia sp. RSA 986]KAJ2212344.1 hypothetical protein EV179_004739 [Coemansia sp. RSA 487]KAJ2566691.1 hypothetical protein IW140_004814 [Coemansia sp. RSA 1813]